LPSVQAAATREAYRAAVQGMLAALGDPVTRVCAQADGSRQSSADRPPFLRKSRDGVPIIAVAAFDRSDWDSPLRELNAILPELARERQIVFDLRGASTTAAFALSWSGLDRRLATKTLAGAGQRSRVHIGFAAQEGSASGGYHSAFRIADATRYEPHKDA